MENINFTASIDEEHLSSIEKIAKNLEEIGCRITGIQAITGTISGSVKRGTAIEDLKIEGIKHVEPDREIRSY